MAGADTEIFGENEAAANTAGGPSIKDYISKYLWYWPLFIVSLAFCLSIGFLYLRYTAPKYMATTLILVKSDAKTNNTEDLIAKALNGEAKDNLENEIQLIRSRRLMERVVVNNNLNISYFIVGKFRNSDVYLDAPLRLTPQKITDSSASVTINIENLNNDGVTIEYGPEKNQKTLNVKWNAPFSIGGNQFSLSPSVKSFAGTGKYVVSWHPVAATMDEISTKFSVDAPDKKASIIKLYILIENQQRGQDILNGICKEFNQADIEDKNIATARTISFIDDRLTAIYKDLNGVEGNLEDYQGNAQIVNVASQSSQSFQNQDASTKSLTDINIQQGVIEMIQNYFNSNGSEGKLVPSSLGINDATLSSLITRYNELQLKKERETPLLAVNSPLVKDMNNQINDVKGSILENLQNITKNLKLQESSFKEKNSQYNQFLAALPHKERVMQGIKRKQSITEGLYLYLLQKREESSISASSANISIYKQIDPAIGYGPVEPNNKNIFMYAALLGLLLPIGWISLRDVMNETVTSRKDVTKRVKLPVAGEIGNIARSKTKEIAVTEPTEIGEQFRIIRSNLSTRQKDQQVILVTSSTSGEGKSLISLNLAAVLAMPGKKVALLELDLRNPGISSSLSISAAKGLVDYITGATKNLADICHNVPDIASMHFYPSGHVQANPADLLLNENIPTLFSLLKLKYDYIIVDCAPTGLVSDAFILNEYCDTVLYVVRLQHTLKKQLDLIADITASGKLSNISLIINDVKTGRSNETSYGIKYNYMYGKQKNNNKFWKRFIPA